MVQYHVYPGGRKRIVTFSYDDGAPQDERLVELFNKYLVKATFHLNGNNYIGKTEEELVSSISGNDKIWYATNIDIYNYITAQKNLQISTDKRVFYNPSSIDLWVEKDKKQIIEIPAGKIVRI